MKDFDKLKKDCRKAIEEVAQPNSGYGKLFVSPQGRAWFVTWDGDEESYAKEIKHRLESVVGKGKVDMMPELSPPKDEEWDEVKLKYTKMALLHRLHRVAVDLEENEMQYEASIIHDVFVRVAEVEKLLEHQDVIQAEMTLEDALNNYDSNIYRVDPKGNWNPEEWITIEKFMESMPEGSLSAPAAIDANHIAFELPDVGFQVVNLVPRSEWKQSDQSNDVLKSNNEDNQTDGKKANDETKGEKKITVKEFHRILKKLTGQEDDSSLSSDVKNGADDFREQLESIINQFSKENGSDTPDFVLAEYLNDCLQAFDKAVSHRTKLQGNDGEDSVTFVSDELAKTAKAADRYQRYALADAIDHLSAKLAKNHGGLDDWFENEKWRDLRRPKKDGGYEECGRGDTDEGKKPVCVPANKAKNLSEKERKERLKQKSRKEKEPSEGKKPKTTTYTDGAGGKSNIS